MIPYLRPVSLLVFIALVCPSPAKESSIALFKVINDPILAHRVMPNFVLQREQMTPRAGLAELNSFTLNLSGTDVVATRTRFVRHTPGHFEWIGGIQGDANSSMLLVSYYGILTGHLDFQGITYEVKSGGSGVCFLDKMDLSAIRKAAPKSNHDGVELKTAKGPGLSKQSVAAGKQAANPVIDVMVLYDQACLNRRSDIVPFINTLVAETNDALLRSGITQTLRLVHTEKYEGNYSAPTDEALDRLAIDPAIASIRKKFGADLVSVLTANQAPGAAGIAGLGSFPSLVFLDGASSYKLFAHELAHSMGAQHNREVSTNPSGYAYAYVSRAGKFSTITAYEPEDGCCPQIWNYSNPSVYHNGFATGIADIADNARAMREYGPQVAAFMSDGNVLTLAKTGSGKIKSDIGGLDCGTVCSQKFPKPEIKTIILTASADPGWTFQGWEGGCKGTGACVVVVDQDKNISARFTANTDFLSINLMDTKTNRTVATLAANSTFRLDTLPGQFTFEAKAQSPVGSVKFELSGPQFHTLLETAAPFGLFGKTNGVLQAWEPAPSAGRYNFSVSVFTKPDGTGTALVTKTLILDLKPPLISTSLGIQDDGLTGFALSPNGFRINLRQEAFMQGSLVNLSGKEVKNFKFRLAKGMNSLAWPGGSLSGGTYLLRIDEGTTRIRRVIQVP